MTMLLGCAEGLQRLDKEWQKLDCPLQQADFIAREGVRLAAADNAAGLLWHSGRLLPCPRGVEALSLWHGHALLLSSDTDCLTLYDPAGEPLITARVGVYPQALCLHRDTAYVCGGSDGCIHALSMPELYQLDSWSLPGMTQRIAATDAALHVLCLTEDAGLQCLLVRLDRHSGRWEITQRWPGLPGAIAAGADGTLWAAASEQLYRLSPDAAVTDVYEGFGLIRHIDVHHNMALVTDPLEELCAVCSHEGAAVVYRGNVGQALLMRHPLHAESAHPEG